MSLKVASVQEKSTRSAAASSAADVIVLDSSGDDDLKTNVMYVNKLLSVCVFPFYLCVHV